jgi:hypothetical protein
MCTIIEEWIDWLTIERVDVSFFVANYSVPDKGISIKRSNWFAAMTMNKSKFISHEYVQQRCT